MPRLIPEWKELQFKINQKLQSAKDSASSTDRKENLATSVYLNDKPEMVYRVSHYPNFLQSVGFYSSNNDSYFVNFEGEGLDEQRKVKLWIHSQSDTNEVEQMEFPMEEKVHVKHMCHCGHHRILVTFCNDFHLRVYGDHNQQIKILATVKCPYSVVSMCYCEDTDEVITGAVGIIVFWVFNHNLFSLLCISKVIQLESGQFVNHISVEEHYKWLVILCDNSIKVYDYQKKVEVRTFEANFRSSLTCSATNWLHRHLYVGDVAGYLQMWSFETSHRVCEIRAHLRSITSIICRPSIHSLLTASMDHMVKEWSLTGFELLRSLNMEDEVRQFQMADENSFYCRTTYTFSVWMLNTFYRLFNAMGSSVTKISRVQHSAGRTKIVATTEDGVIRFLSPVTGEMLFITWPYLVLEKVIDYIYDPEIEELFVATGSNKIFVLDTSMCPCPAKYILCPSEIKDDNVLCLASCRNKVGEVMLHLVFSGHKSGQIRLISPHDYFMAEHKIHNGSVIALHSPSSEDLLVDSIYSELLCSYGMDYYIVISRWRVRQKEVRLEPLANLYCTCKLRLILLVPGLICAVTASNTLRLWGVDDLSLLRGDINQSFIETNEIQTEPITSFDYCQTLGLILTGGRDGTVRIWDGRGNVVAEFGISQQLQSACFGSCRGDILVSFNHNIYVVSCLIYLPDEMLKTLASLEEPEDYTESPLPFQPNNQVAFDNVLIPKLFHLGKKAQHHKVTKINRSKDRVIQAVMQEATWHVDPKQQQRIQDADMCAEKEIEIQEGLLTTITGHAPIKQKTHYVALKNKDVPPPPERDSYKHSGNKQLIEGLSQRYWPIAPDGYIPNSVIRAAIWVDQTPWHLLDSSFRRHLTKNVCLPKKVYLKKKRAPQRQLFLWPLDMMDKVELEEPDDFKDESILNIVEQDQDAEESPTRDILSEIAKSSWLGANLSKINLSSVIYAIAKRMSSVPLFIYKFCIEGLLKIFKTYQVPQSLKDEICKLLYKDTLDKSSVKRLTAWKTLEQLGILAPTLVSHMAKSLLDDDKTVRIQARTMMKSHYNVATKKSLLKMLRKMAIMQDMMEQPFVQNKEDDAASPPLTITMSIGAVEELCTQLNARLTEDLQLLPSQSVTTTQAAEPKEVIDRGRAETKVDISRTWRALSLTLIPPVQTQSTTKISLTKIQPTSTIRYTPFSENILTAKLPPISTQKGADVLTDKKHGALEITSKLSGRKGKVFEKETKLKPLSPKAKKGGAELEHSTKTKTLRDRAERKEHRPTVLPLKKPGQLLHSKSGESLDSLYTGDQSGESLDSLYTGDQAPRETKGKIRDGFISLKNTLARIRQGSFKAPRFDEKEKQKEELRMVGDIRTEVPFEVSYPVDEYQEELVVHLRDQSWQKGKNGDDKHVFKIDPQKEYGMVYDSWKRHIQSLVERYELESAGSQVKIQELVTDFRRSSQENIAKAPPNLLDFMQTQMDRGSFKVSDICPEIVEAMRLAATVLPSKEWANLWSGFHSLEDSKKTWKDLRASQEPRKQTKVAPHKLPRVMEGEITPVAHLKESEFQGKTPPQQRSVEDQLHGRETGIELWGSEPKQGLSPLPLPSRLTPADTVTWETFLRSQQEQGLSPFVVMPSITPSDSTTWKKGLGSERKLEQRLGQLPVPSRVALPDTANWEKFQIVIPYLFYVKQLNATYRNELADCLYCLKTLRRLKHKDPKYKKEEEVGVRRRLPSIMSRGFQVGNAVVGQRVLNKVLFEDLGESSIGLHHVVPLYWQNNVQPLRQSGTTKYGALRLRWVTGRQPVRMCFSPI